MVGKEYYLQTRLNATAAVAVAAWYNLQQRKRHHLQTGYYRMGGYSLWYSTEVLL